MSKEKWLTYVAALANALHVKMFPETWIDFNGLRQDLRGANLYELAQRIRHGADWGAIERMADNMRSQLRIVDGGKDA